MKLPDQFGPRFIRDLMNKCWKEDYQERPSFKVSIFSFLYFQN